MRSKKALMSWREWRTWSTTRKVRMFSRKRESLRRGKRLAKAKIKMVRRKSRDEWARMKELVE